MVVSSDHVFQVGDMVWAKMKSQPWWPARVYPEDFATPMVRRSKREGLLLVALFGATSFGWFGSSELIPFDSNYAEMSVQTTSKAFVKAVEDAVAEVNRRVGLGFSCMCGGSKRSFRDEAGCDSGTVYSVDAIRKARVGFQPELVSGFLRRLALEAASGEDVEDIEFIKNKATVLAYRKAVFEDFDEQPPKDSAYKAPLSRMVVKKTAKFKGHAKKDDYILKRRDEKEIKKEKENVASPILLVSFKDSTSDSGEAALKDAPCIDQAKVKSTADEKRIMQEVEGKKVILHPKERVSGKIVMSENKKKQKEDEVSLAEMFLTKKRSQREGPQRSNGNYETDLSRVLSDLHALAVDPCNTINRGSCIKGKKACLRFRSLVFKKSKNFSLALANGELNANKPSEVPPVKLPSGLKQGPPDHQEELTVAKKQDVKQAVATTLKKPGPGTGPGPGPTMLILKFLQGGSLPSFNELKARFMRYGPMDHSATKILRKTFSCELVFRHKADAQAARRFVVESSNLFGNTGVKCTLKDVGGMDATKPEPPLEVQKDHHQSAMGVRPPSILKASGGEEAAGKGSREGDLIRAVHDPRSLAVDPFNKVNGSLHVKGMKAKGQNFSLPVAVGETNASKFSKDSVEASPVKPLSGPKRGPPSLQEQIRAAKRKKACDIINSTKEEKKITKMIDQPGSGPGPTILMLKFPQGGSLPSYNELKARFTRYGPLDHSATHIFWNTLSCQVLFRHRAHAQAAHKFVVESSSVFGNTGVKCTLKEVEAPTNRHQPDVNRPLKSILKKSDGEEAAGRGRVKFMASKDESQLKNKSGTTSFSSLTDFSSKNFGKDVNPSGVAGPSTTPPPQPPPLVPPVITHSVQTTPLPLMAPNIDIETQMLSLLTRCNDVVTNVSSLMVFLNESSMKLQNQYERLTFRLMKAGLLGFLGSPKAC
ncbi:PWWP domain-containing protein 1-like [Bidens hawaiensis]|uniref:PWWP domain-containing protein 1-like n=1 Tax=Bidens hawaiensis TaxID=980011 RepID=UPI00404A6833